MSYPVGPAPDGAFRVGTVRDAQGLNEESVKAIIRGKNLAPWQGAQGEMRQNVLSPAEQQQQIINDHSRSIEEIRAAVGQGLLQGQAIKFETNNTYYPTEGITSFDVILIGGGGGGGGAEWNVLTAPAGGCGGSGGGETHTTVSASMLPRNAENTAYLGVPIIVGAGGSGAPYAGVGTGGGDSRLADYLTAGGGVGGVKGALAATSAPGGAGFIPGGHGGVTWKTTDGGVPAQQATPGTNSISQYTLNGGGGGGGAGATGTSSNAPGSSGGAGGLSPGGVYVAGAVGAPGSAPSPVVATGGGGGAGGGAGRHGGPGGYPGGGGGGAGGSAVMNDTSMRGGDGAHGIVFIIERFG